MKPAKNDILVAIKRSVAEGNYRYTVHGAQQRIARNVSGRELEEAMAVA